MLKLDEVFKEIKRRQKNFATANDGDAFEKTLIRLLDECQATKLLNDQAAKLQGDIDVQNHISKIIKRDIKFVKSEWNQLKASVLAKNSIEPIKNPWPILNNHFIHQPFGKQNYPDFLFFLGGHIVPVEVKYSKASTKKTNLEAIRPMWNSNVPKGNGIYIFGVATQAVTFFGGSDILDSETRVVLNKFFDDLGAEDKEGVDLTSKMNEYLKNLDNPFGFKPYVRRAFEQSVSFSTNLDEEGKKYIESYFSDRSQEREKNVIDFLANLSKNDFIK